MGSATKPEPIAFITLITELRELEVAEAQVLPDSLKIRLYHRLDEEFIGDEGGRGRKKKC